MRNKKKSRVGGNIKKFLCFFLVFLLFFSFVGCAKNTPDIKNTPEVQQIYNNDIYEFIDNETGVHYLIYSHKYDGYAAGMGGITPRLNSDGSVMTE